MNLDNFLKEKNEKCNKCRWCTNNICMNVASWFSGVNIEYENCDNCSYYYPENENEIYNNIDEETESLFD